MLLNKLFKSVLEQDRAPIVICDLEHTIVYMNPVAIERYHKDLTGRNLKTCHNEKENKDVYMVALRDDDGALIGYYEKHEYRTKEKGKLYEI